MTVADLFAALAELSGILFVVTSMLAMGLSLSVAQIVEPLKNIRLVVLALLANFVVAPLLAYVILLVIPLEQSLAIGLIIMSTAAGAPFMSKLVELAKGDTALGVGLMVLFMGVTIVYLPTVLPFLLPGVQVNPWDIAQSLIVLMLIPLAIGLLIKSGAADTAARYLPFMSKVSSLSILVLLVTGLGLNVSNILGLIGSRGILALLLFVAGTFITGLLFGGRRPDTRSVLALGTAQRNISAAIVVVAQNFTTGNTLSFVLVASILFLLILMPTARRFGKGEQVASPDAPVDVAA